MNSKLGIGDRGEDTGGDGRSKLTLDGVGMKSRVGRAYERLTDDIRGQDLGAEQAAGDLGHRGPAVVIGAAGHGGRRADALQTGRRQQRADSPHQQGHIGALAAAVGVKLVEHEELQALAMADHLLVDLVLTGHQVFEHHEVRQQDVGRLGRDRPASVVAVLPCVASERDGPGRCHELEELLQLLHLAVGQRVHRVDDDGAGSLGLVLRPGADDGVNDRDEEAQ